MTLGLDVSDAAARAVVVDEHGQVLARGEESFTSSGLVRAASAAVSRAAADSGGTVSRAAVALPTPGDVVAPDLVTSLMELLPGIPAPQAVSSGLAAVVAEQWCGAARGFQDVVALSIGEHVTAGILLGGRPWLGAHGLAGSLGWFALNPVERQDYRRLGGLEAEISAAGIVRRIVWRIKAGDESVIASRNGGDLTLVTAAQVFDGARIGDGVAVSVIRDTAKYIGMALSNVAATIDPQAIVLGGMISACGDMLLEAIRLECGRRLRPAQAERLRVLLSPLGPDAAAIGAARLASHPA